MTRTNVSNFPQQITNIDGEKQVILITILAHRTNEDGEVVPLTKSQINAARANAEASLEVLDGTEVLGTSTALLLPDVPLADGESITLTVDAAIIKNTVDDEPTTEPEPEQAVETETESAPEPTSEPEPEQAAEPEAESAPEPTAEPEQAVETETESAAE